MYTCSYIFHINVYTYVLIVHTQGDMYASILWVRTYVPTCESTPMYRYTDPIYILYYIYYIIYILYILLLYYILYSYIQIRYHYLKREAVSHWLLQGLPQKRQTDVGT